MKKKASEYAYPQIIIEMAVNGDTFQSLANGIGLTRQTIYNKVEGKVQWKANDIEAICKRYNKSYNELFKRGE